MSPEAMQQLARRSAQSARVTRRRPGLIPEIPDGVDWWDPLADNAVRPDLDAVLVNGVRVCARQQGPAAAVADAPTPRTSSSRAGRRRVTSVHEDVDGEQYVGVIVEDDPEVEMPDWYGRYLYFAPDEVEPLVDVRP